MPSNQRLIIDITAELDFEICNKIDSDSDVVRWKTPAAYNFFLVRIFEGFDILVLIYDQFRLIKP